MYVCMCCQHSNRLNRAPMISFAGQSLMCYYDRKVSFDSSTVLYSTFSYRQLGRTVSGPGERAQVLPLLLVSFYLYLANYSFLIDRNLFLSSFTDWNLGVRISEARTALLYTIAAIAIFSALFSKNQAWLGSQLCNLDSFYCQKSS